jgi:hypothetical protein
MIRICSSRSGGQVRIRFTSVSKSGKVKESSFIPYRLWKERTTMSRRRRASAFPSANAFDEDVQRSLQAGMNAHLSAKKRTTPRAARAYPLTALPGVIE